LNGQHRRVTSAAFFDLDRTVMAGASTWYFGAAALKHGVYSRRALARDAIKAVRFIRQGSTDESADALRDQILDAVQGLRRDDMDDLVPDVLGPILGRVHPELYTRILEHERAGVATYLCSASPAEILEPIARALSMSGGALGTVAAVDGDGVYTGALDRPFCYGNGKRIAIEREAVERRIDLRSSYAYSDSASDLPMLEAVGNPFVVNPDTELRAIASERGWPELEVTRPRVPWRSRTIAVSLVAGAGFAVGRATARR
jgi:HAD superfamily hydrolase (TIGR01490 family)